MRTYEEYKKERQEAVKATNCTACGKMAACDSFHVRGFRDETCSNETVDWVGWLCGECEDRLLAVLDGEVVDEG